MCVCVGGGGGEGDSVVSMCGVICGVLWRSM